MRGTVAPSSPNRSSISAVAASSFSSVLRLRSCCGFPIGGFIRIILVAGLTFCECEYTFTLGVDPMQTLSPHNPLWFHALALLLIVVSPPVSYFYEGPFLRRISSSAQKIRFYRYIVCAQWPSAAAALWIAGPGNILFPPSS